MNRIRIALVDDHPIVRQGLRAVLDAETDFEVVGEADSGIAAGALVERLRPEVLVLDVVLPDLNGLEVARQVARRSPRTRVLILSMHSGEAYVLEAMRCGAAGYLLKEASADELVRAVREVGSGRRYLCPPYSDLAIEAYLRRTEPHPLDPYETLTTREREVLHLAARGLSNGEIADRLSISRRTAETHRAHLMRKLGLHNQTELVRFVLHQTPLPPAS